MSASSQVTGPLFKWFGSKWLSSATLPPPKYGSIVEPFAGGAAYSLRYSGKDVTICERDQFILPLWKWLIETATPSDIMEIPVNNREGDNILDFDLSYGQKLLLKSWQRTNNVGRCWTISCWGCNGKGMWSRHVRDRIASEIGAIKHWKVFDDGMKVLREETWEATWFVDPPYQYNYQYRGKPLCYDELSQLILAARGQKIVCEAACPNTGRFPIWLPFEDWGFRATSRAQDGMNSVSRELLWVDG